MNDRAEQIINDKRIEMLPNRKIFMVQGYKGDWYNVRLFKNGSYRPYCSCPATTICSHLLAVMLSLDYKNTCAKLPNSEVLRNRTKTSRGKRSGCKGGNCRPSKKRKSSVRNIIIIHYYHKTDLFNYINRMVLQSMPHSFRIWPMNKKKCCRWKTKRQISVYR
jgi:hypothetical protein